MRQSWVCCSLLVTFSSPALASTLYPSVLQEELALAQAPDCQLCHTTSRGGPNTARKPFAQTLIARGLTGAANVATLRTLIRELNDADSDRDGAPDVEELQQASDPNDAESMPEEPNTMPPRVDAGPTLPPLDAGHVAESDGSAVASQRQDAGRDAAFEVSSAEATSTLNDTRPAELTSENPKAHAQSSGGCVVKARAGHPLHASFLGLAALAAAFRRRTGVAIS